jgi:hypothetical protein
MPFGTLRIAANRYGAINENQILLLRHILLKIRILNKK